MLATTAPLPGETAEILGAERRATITCEYCHERYVLEAADLYVDYSKNLITDDTIGKISLIGAGMRSSSGVSAKFFGALRDAGINLYRMLVPMGMVAAVMTDASPDAVTRTPAKHSRSKSIVAFARASAASAARWRTGLRVE